MGGDTWHALRCGTCQNIVKAVRVQPAFLRGWYQWVIKQGWSDGQFQILLQWLHTPIQPNILEDPLRIPHPLKNTFMSCSLQKHIPRNPKPRWPKKPTKSTQTPRYLHLYPLTCLYQQKPVLFQKKTPPFPLTLQMKVLLVKNSEVSTFIL